MIMTCKSTNSDEKINKKVLNAVNLMWHLCSFFVANDHTLCKFRCCILNKIQGSILEGSNIFPTNLEFIDYWIVNIIWYKFNAVEKSFARMVRANDHHSGQKTLKDSTPSVNVIKVQTLSVITIKHQGNMAHRYNLDRDPNILSAIFTG